MREILFRGKTYDEEWVEGSLHIEHGETTKDGKRDEDYRILGTRGECRYIIPETVGQFTGLYDSTKWEELTTEEQALFLYPENGGKRSKEDWKGKPIFECDVVECFSSDYAGRPKIDTIIVRDMTDYNTMVYLNCSNKLKIIGNIHDNPELLEVKK